MEILTTPACGVLLQPIGAMIEWPASESSRKRVNKSLRKVFGPYRQIPRRRETAESGHVKSEHIDRFSMQSIVSGNYLPSCFTEEDCVHTERNDRN
jgi:hypothetical protein